MCFARGAGIPWGRIVLAMLVALVLCDSAVAMAADEAQAKPFAVPWEVFAFTLTACGSLYAWVQARLSGIDKKLAQLDVLSERVNHMPTAAHLERLSADIRVNSERTSTMMARLDRIEDWLSNNTVPKS